MFVFSTKCFRLLVAATLLLFGGGGGGPQPAKGLNCWECNANLAAHAILDHQCDHSGNGESAECPGPNGVCIIEVRTTKDPPTTIIQKGCKEEPKPHLGKCEITQDKYGKTEMCHCNTPDNCNKDLIDGKGDGKYGKGSGEKLFLNGLTVMLMILIARCIALN